MTYHIIFFLYGIFYSDQFLFINDLIVIFLFLYIKTIKHYMFYTFYIDLFNHQKIYNFV
jgi:hypothetical protein